MHVSHLPFHFSRSRSASSSSSSSSMVALASNPLPPPGLEMYSCIGSSVPTVTSADCSCRCTLSCASSMISSMKSSGVTARWSSVMISVTVRSLPYAVADMISSSYSRSGSASLAVTCSACGCSSSTDRCTMTVSHESLENCSDTLRSFRTGIFDRLELSGSGDLAATTASGFGAAGLVVPKRGILEATDSACSTTDSIISSARDDSSACCCSIVCFGWSAVSMRSTADGSPSAGWAAGMGGWSFASGELFFDGTGILEVTSCVTVRATVSCTTGLSIDTFSSTRRRTSSSRSTIFSLTVSSPWLTPVSTLLTAVPVRSATIPAASWLTTSDCSPSNRSTVYAAAVDTCGAVPSPICTVSTLLRAAILSAVSFTSRCMSRFSTAGSWSRTSRTTDSTVRSTMLLLSALRATNSSRTIVSSPLPRVNASRPSGRPATVFVSTVVDILVTVSSTLLTVSDLKCWEMLSSRLEVLLPVASESDDGSESGSFDCAGPASAAPKASSKLSLFSSTACNTSCRSSCSTVVNACCVVVTTDDSPTVRWTLECSSLRSNGSCSESSEICSDDSVLDFVSNELIRCFTSLIDSSTTPWNSSGSLVRLVRFAGTGARSFGTGGTALSTGCCSAGTVGSSSAAGTRSSTFFLISSTTRGDDAATVVSVASCSSTSDRCSNSSTFFSVTLNLSCSSCSNSSFRTPGPSLTTVVFSFTTGSGMVDDLYVLSIGFWSSISSSCLARVSSITLCRLMVMISSTISRFCVEAGIERSADRRFSICFRRSATVFFTISSSDSSDSSTVFSSAEYFVDSCFERRSSNSTASTLRLPIEKEVLLRIVTVVVVPVVVALRMHRSTISSRWMVRSPFSSMLKSLFGFDWNCFSMACACWAVLAGIWATMFSTSVSLTPISGASRIQSSPSRLEMSTMRSSPR
uniref:Uncharacterized protein n=1 Tax=Anopheles merus TaxID=30066 RepID=A0A182V7A4_ANOME